MDRHGNTRDLVFDVPTLLATISAGLTLQPGDVVAAGTPAGVGIGFRGSIAMGETQGVTSAAPPMPAAFLGHGSPMNALESNRFTSAWKAFGASVPRPRGIVVVSAHWYENATAVTAMLHPRTIHDFYGFPRELFQVQYPAPGDRSLAEEVSDVAKPTRVGLDEDSWGIDHGAWSVLVHAFPRAEIPVVQLSINALKPLDFHLELGAKLAPLRDRGVLIVGSGNVVHNLRALDWARPEFGFDWARRFDEEARSIMTSRPADAARLGEHADFGRAAPTPDHFVPLLYLAGLAAAARRPADVLVEGYDFGSLSMTCYTLDAAPTHGGAGRERTGSAAALGDVPAEETNI